MTQLAASVQREVSLLDAVQSAEARHEHDQGQEEQDGDDDDDVGDRLGRLLLTVIVVFHWCKQQKYRNSGVMQTGCSLLYIVQVFL